MHNILFHAGPLTLYTYGLMVAIGILAAFFVAERRGRKMGINVDKLDGLTLWLLAGGFICSKLLYWLTRIQDIVQDPSILLNLGDGWVVYGGIIGGLLGGWLYCRRNRMNFWTYFDLLIPEVALAQGFGRLGCFFAGCCYGIETHEWYGLVFPEGSLAPAGVSLFPTQLLSSAFDFALFFVLLWMSKRKRFDGELGGWYLIFYSIGRFIIEFFRGDAVRGGIGLLSTSQWISLVMLACGILIVAFLPAFLNRRKTA